MNKDNPEAQDTLSLHEQIKPEVRQYPHNRKALYKNSASALLITAMTFAGFVIAYQDQKDIVEIKKDCPKTAHPCNTKALTTFFEGLGTVALSGFFSMYATRRRQDVYNDHLQKMVDESKAFDDDGNQTPQPPKIS